MLFNPFNTYLEICVINPLFTNEETEAWKECFTTKNEQKQGLSPQPFLM